MAKENVNLFLKKFVEDADLADRLSTCKSPDEAYAIASSVQDGFTKEEFIETMKIIDAANRGELSEEDLRAVSGGDSCSTITTVTTATVIPITTGAAGLAAI